jgi:Zn-finger nucleic acid-binding protein
MDFKTFERLKKNYEGYIKEAERLIRLGEAIEQSRSVWIDRGKIERLLEQTDPKSGGIKVFFGQYDEESLGEFDIPVKPEDYKSRLTVILAASNNNEDPTEESQLENFGKICPPDCG